MTYRGLVITGTDTGVGKTTVAAAMARLFREQGIKAGVLKPVETGCEGHDLKPRDGLCLARAAGVGLDFEGCEDDDKPWTTAAVDDVVPWRFSAPLAPEEAARAAGAQITVDRIYQAMDRWMERADLVIVETAGGLMVPVNPRFTFADLMVGLELPVLVVARNRLGVVNHALLTVEALRSRNLEPLALVLNSLDKSPDQSAATNAEVIRRHAGTPVYEAPCAGGGEGGEPDAEAVVARALLPDLDKIIIAMKADWRRTAKRHVGGPDSKDGERRS
jgi:dethiobiotin synthetase